tara:strand:+ start:1168 stop:1374 length:207 start_codon:yes stop_codon:yes gene_type:complete
MQVREKAAPPLTVKTTVPDPLRVIRNLRGMASADPGNAAGLLEAIDYILTVNSKLAGARSILDDLREV